MLFGGLDEQRLRLRRRVAVLAGVLLLAGADGGRIAAGTSQDTAMDGSARSTSAAGADGGHPLYLEPPPAGVLPRSPRPPGAGTPDAADRAYGIPVTVLVAYRRAADALGQDDPGCHLSWPVLAGIGRVESNHGRGGDVDARGTMIHPIFGPQLDGRNGTASMPDPSGGWVRAEGPMQFLPATWRHWAADGNADGVADPQNVFDAALTAGRYLCAGPADLSTVTGLRNAVLRYNNSEQYVATVTKWINVYRHGGFPVPDNPNSDSPESVRLVARTETPPGPPPPGNPPAGPVGHNPENPPPPPHAGPTPPPAGPGNPPPTPRQAPQCPAPPSVVPAPSAGEPSANPVQCLVDGVVRTLLVGPQNPPQVPPLPPLNGVSLPLPGSG